METKQSFSFHDGVAVDDEEISQWHTEVYQALQKEGDHYSVRSGNSIVFGTKDKDGEITIYEVNNGYIQHTYTTD